MASLNNLRQAITSSQLEAHRDEIEKVALPSARVIPSGALDTVPDRISRLGGHPDAPGEFTWPTYEAEGKTLALAFVAQIDCAKLPRDAVPAEMPVSGILSFFFDTAEQPWGFDGEDDGARVFYTTEDTPLQRTEPPPGTPVHPAIKLEVSSDWTLSEGLICDRDLGEELMEFRDVLRADPKHPVHRLGGYDDAVQNPVLEGFESSMDDPVLLLQLDSDEDADWMFGDIGMVYWVIDRVDLAACRFDRARYTLQCC